MTTSTAIQFNTRNSSWVRAISYNQEAQVLSVEPRISAVIIHYSDVPADVANGLSNALEMNDGHAGEAFNRLIRNATDDQGQSLYPFRYQQLTWVQM